MFIFISMLILGIIAMIAGALNVFCSCKGDKRGLFGIIFVAAGVSFVIYSFNEEFRKGVVKDYLRGRITVTYQDVYQDSLIIRRDTIINF